MQPKVGIASGGVLVHTQRWLRVERPAKTEIWYQHPIWEGEWTAAYRLVPEGNQLVTAEVRVYPFESRRGKPVRDPGTWFAEEMDTDELAEHGLVPKGGLPTEALREVLPFGVIEEVSKSLERLIEQYPYLRDRLFDPSKTWGSLRLRGEMLGSRPTRPGRRGRSDLAYAVLAREYVGWVSSSPGTATIRLADRIGIEPKQLRNLLSQARSRGLLSAAPPGRAGGELTSRALDVLSAAERDGIDLRAALIELFGKGQGTRRRKTRPRGGRLK